MEMREELTYTRRADRNTRRADRNTIRPDRNKVTADRNTIRADRNTIRADRNTIRADRNLSTSFKKSINIFHHTAAVTGPMVTILGAVSTNVCKGFL